MKKVLSVILSVAMVLSMVACLAFVTSAETIEKDALKVEVVEIDSQDYVKVTYSSVKAFMVTLLKFDVTGIEQIVDDDEDPDGIHPYAEAVVPDDVADPSVDPVLSDDELKVLVAPGSEGDEELLDQYNQIIIWIPVKLADGQYTVTPTVAQAAADGTGEDDMEDFVNPEFTVDEAGTITTDPAVLEEYVEEAKHIHDFTYDYGKNEEGHWGICECGAEADAVEHDPAYRHTSEGLDEEYCSICGLTLDVDVPCVDDDKDGDCDNCGEEMPSTEPVVDNGIVFHDSSSAGLVSTSVCFNFRIAQSVLESYADFEMVLIPGKYDVDTFNIVAEPESIIVKKNQFSSLKATAKYPARYNYTYAEIQLYELGLDIQYYIKCYDAEGKYVARSNEFSLCPATEIKAQIASNDKATFKTALTDLLIICDEARKLFPDNPECDLAKSISVLEGFDTSCASSELPTLNTPDDFRASDNRFATAAGSTYRFQISATIGKVPELTYRFTDSSANRLDPSKLVMTINYTSSDATPHEQVVTGDMWVRYNDKLSYNYADIGLDDSAALITATVTYDGNPAFTYEYAVESYLNKNMSNANLGGMMAALAKFGTSFRILMGVQ